MRDIQTASALGGGTITYYRRNGVFLRRVSCPDHYYRDDTTRFEVEWEIYTMLDEHDLEGAYHVYRASFREWKPGDGKPGWYHDAMVGRFYNQGDAIDHAVRGAEGEDLLYTDTIEDDK